MNDFHVSFGIITYSKDGVSDHLLNVVSSIRNLKIPKYEIIIVGTKHTIIKSISGDDVVVVDFDEDRKKAWITRKKNLITQIAKYENIVYQHDYIIYDDNWYESWRNFGNYAIGMNRIFNVDGSRYRDWLLFPNGGLIERVKRLSGYIDEERGCLLPYDETGMSKLMYISGSWWIAKKHVMQEFLLNESLSWGHGEDVEWSYNVRNKYKFSINESASVRLLKHNGVVFAPIRAEVLAKMREFLISKNMYG